ncbi:pyridoxal phosphate-dependent aminotransferase [Dictyobacter aurantiacus]|uniref:histidinol-phosphate transaminase n=1 Tax=Dictyobacter aurantiacus TaxID=1936993 RepID=A0A401Z8Y5_9CHLR|nr:histidinol-phosphate transaminase [Dictyobacter aurantiacus]GCE03337.1 aminotransferase [Dictyobacter aurantiacus]
MSDAIHPSSRAIHGAIDYAELEQLGLQADDVLDFSVNSNPYGPSPRVRIALNDVVLDRYPDRECRQLRRAIVQHELVAAGLSIDTLVCGNGSSELIWAIARAFLSAGETTALLNPTFGEYAAASRVTGASIIDYRTCEVDDFQLNIEHCCNWLYEQRPRLVWLCNPNNPTGGWLGREQVLALLAACQRLNALLIVDESYWHFLWPNDAFSAIEFLHSSYMHHILVLRSLTKDFALAGVRLGYVVGAVEQIRCIQEQLPAWNVSAVAAAAGEAALADRSYLQDCMLRLIEERHAFFEALRSSGWRVIPSRTHFCLLEAGSAWSVRQQLLRRGLLVRDCSSFGLPQFIRVATRPQADWSRLVEALKEVMKIC